MRIRMLVIATLMTCAFGQLSAANYYISPTGSDSDTGVSPVHAWATLQHARSTALAAGDTLFIMGGVYTTGQTFLEGYNGHNLTGTADHPFVIKAYGDGVAEFRKVPETTTDGDLRQFFRFWNNTGAFTCEYIIIDGFGKLNGLPYQILLKPEAGQTNMTWAVAATSNSSTYQYRNITFRGIEIDGSNAGVSFSAGMCFLNCKYLDIDNCYVHHTSRPTGDIPPGDGTNVSQSNGQSIDFRSCQFGKIRNCTFSHSNHGLIDMERSVQFAPNYGYYCAYFKITNNIFDNHYGAGLFLIRNTHHCLVDGNIFIHSGETTSYPKPPIQVSGWSNTIRRNVFYNPRGSGIGLNGQASFDGRENYMANDNLIYNNTLFQNKNCDLFLYANNEIIGVGQKGDSSSCENNGIYNNIFYKAYGPYIGDPSHIYKAEFLFDTYRANFTHNWINPDNSSTFPASTAWGGNKFHNNLLRYDSGGAANDSIVVFARDMDLGGGFHVYGLTNLQADGSGAWANNIGFDPQLISEDPETYGPTRGWWHIQSTSPCVDRGMIVNDVNGAYVEANFPGFGWGNLSYQGSAPDIGAYEYGGENPSPLSPPPLNCTPGRK